MRLGFLPGLPRLPLVVGPERAADGRLSRLVAWLEDERARVDALLLSHGALLLRGFEVHDVDDFQAVTGTIAPSLADYVRGTSPRSRVKGNIWTSTDLPRQLPIPLHCEMAYSDRWPSHVLFHCVQPSPVGGETPIADVRRVYRRIDPEVRERFEALGLRLIQNVPKATRPLGFRGWTDMFQSDDRAVVEQRCADQGLAWSWHGETLRLLTDRPGTVPHPITGEPSWFNVAHHFHDSWSSELARYGLPLLALGARIDEALRHRLPALERARHCTFGDGTEIGRRDLEHVRDVLHAEEIAFPWQRGDVLLLDNVAVAHARRPFRGPRRILAALVPRPAVVAAEAPEPELATVS